MVAQGILWPELRKSLEFITSVWTDIPYYKHDGKQFLEGMTDWQKGWQYNCLDVLSCAEARPKQIAALAEQGNIATYERQRLLIHSAHLLPVAWRTNHYYPSSSPPPSAFP